MMKIRWTSGETLRLAAGRELRRSRWSLRSSGFLAQLIPQPDGTLVEWTAGIPTGLALQLLAASRVFGSVAIWQFGAMLHSPTAAMPALAFCFGFAAAAYVVNRLGARSYYASLAGMLAYAVTAAPSGAAVPADPVSCSLRV